MEQNCAEVEHVWDGNVDAATVVGTRVCKGKDTVGYFILHVMVAVNHSRLAAVLELETHQYPKAPKLQPR